LRPVHRKARPDARPDGAGVAVGCAEYRRGESGLGDLEKDRTQTHQHGQKRSTPSIKSTQSTFPELAANAALVLLAVSCSLLDRQLAALATAFETEGGFTERLYRVRSEKRSSRPPLKGDGTIRIGIAE
jgi:four helix bundle suffix protein